MVPPELSVSPAMLSAVALLNVISALTIAQLAKGEAENAPAKTVPIVFDIVMELPLKVSDPLCPD